MSLKALLNNTLEIEGTRCCSCNVYFFMESKDHAHFMKTGKTFSCPYGHTQVFINKTTESKQIDRLKKAFGNLLTDRCPVCSGVYKYVIQHMQNQHPRELTDLINSLRQ